MGPAIKFGELCRKALPVEVGRGVGNSSLMGGGVVTMSADGEFFAWRLEMYDGSFCGWWCTLTGIVAGSGPPLCLTAFLCSVVL